MINQIYVHFNGRAKPILVDVEDLVQLGGEMIDAVISSGKGLDETTPWLVGFSYDAFLLAVPFDKTTATYPDYQKKQQSEAAQDALLLSFGHLSDICRSPHLRGVLAVFEFFNKPDLIAEIKRGLLAINIKVPKPSTLRLPKPYVQRKVVVPVIAKLTDADVHPVVAHGHRLDTDEYKIEADGLQVDGQQLNTSSDVVGLGSEAGEGVGIGMETGEVVGLVLETTEVAELEMETTEVAELGMETTEVAELGMEATEVAELGLVTSEVSGLGFETTEAAGLGTVTSAVDGLGTEASDIAGLGTEASAVAGFGLETSDVAGFGLEISRHVYSGSSAEKQIMEALFVFPSRGTEKKIGTGSRLTFASNFKFDPAMFPPLVEQPDAGLGDIIGEAAGLGEVIGEAAGLGAVIGETAGLGEVIGEAAGLGEVIGEAAGLGEVIGEAAGLGEVIGEAAGLGEVIGEAAGLDADAPSSNDPVFIPYPRVLQPPISRPNRLG